MSFILNPSHSSCLCFVIYEKNILLREDLSLPSFEDLKQLYNIALDGYEKEPLFFEEKQFNICALDFPCNKKVPNGFIQKPLREFFYEREELLFQSARARSILNWLNEYKYCQTCATKLIFSKKFSALECPTCKKEIFPRIEPCVIVLVRKEDKVLLVKHSYRNQNMFACIAGFMEAGESAEGAVSREVFEETGLSIKNIQYRGSQGWPYPDQLMLGFTADYAFGELKLQKEEIAEAVWCNPKEIPNTPKPGSIAYKLINGIF